MSSTRLEEHILLVGCWDVFDPRVKHSRQSREQFRPVSHLSLVFMVWLRLWRAQQPSAPTTLPVKRTEFGRPEEIWWLMFMSGYVSLFLFCMCFYVYVSVWMRNKDKTFRNGKTFSTMWSSWFRFVSSFGVNRAHGTKIACTRGNALLLLSRKVHIRFISISVGYYRPWVSALTGRKTRTSQTRLGDVM